MAEKRQNESPQGGSPARKPLEAQGGQRADGSTKNKYVESVFLNGQVVNYK